MKITDAMAKAAKETSEKFVTVCRDYLPTTINHHLLVAWLYQNKAGIDLGANDPEVGWAVLTFKGMWTVDNLVEAFEDLKQKGLLQLRPKPWVTPYPMSSVKEARQRIHQMNGSRLQFVSSSMEELKIYPTANGVKECIMACEKEMYLHYFMTAQDYLERATDSENMFDAVELGVNGIINADYAEDCGAPRGKVLELKHKLEEVVKGKICGRG